MGGFRQTITTCVEIPINENESEIVDAQVSVSWRLGRNGIGSYEFWGEAGFDDGSLCPKLDGIEVFDDGLTAAQSAFVRDLVDSDDDFCDRLLERAVEKYNEN